MILGIFKTIFILSLAVLFYSKNTNAEYSLKNISTLKKTQYTTLYDGRKLVGNEAMVSLSQGNLNFSGEVTEFRINFDYSGTSYDVGLSNFNLSSKFIGNFDTLNSSVTLRPINFLIENKYSGNAFSVSRNFDVLENKNNSLKYNFGIAYEQGTLITENKINVAFLSSFPKKTLTNNNLKLIYGTEYKANLTEKTSFVTGLGVGKSISEGGTLQAKNESHSFYFGLTYDFNPNKDRASLISSNSSFDFSIEAAGSNSNQFISGEAKIEEDDFDGTIESNNALNLFSKGYEIRFLKPLNNKQYLMAAIQKSERKTHLEMEQIPISTNKFDAKAKFTFKEVALKFGVRHYLFYEKPMTPYIGYGVKLINADIKEDTSSNYKDANTHALKHNRIFYGGLFSYLGLRTAMSNGYYYVIEGGLEYYNGRPVGVPLSSVGTSISIGVGKSF